MGSADTLKSRADIQRNPSRLEEWADRNLMKFSNNWKVLYLVGNNPCNDAVWRLTGWETALLRRTLGSWWAAGCIGSSSGPWMQSRSRVFILGCMNRSMASRLRETINPPYSLLFALHLHTVSFFGSPNRKKTSINWNKSGGGPPRLLGAGALDLRGKSEGMEFAQSRENLVHLKNMQI